MKMVNPELLESPRPRATGLVIVAASLALVVAFALATPVSSQQPSPSPAKPNIAGEVEVKKANGEKEESPKASDPTGRKPPRVRQPKPPPSYEVVFKTDIPEAEIFLNHGGMSLQSLGKTDAEGKLTTRLVRGTHNITASRSGYRIQRLRIEVRPGANNFNFNLALPVVEAKKEDKPPETAPAPAVEVVADEQTADPLADADAVLKRYFDAKETEGVGATDWQLVRERTTAALEREPDNPRLKAQALAAEAQLAYLTGDYASALVAFNKAVIASPEYVAAHYGLGNAYLATNQPAEAFKAYSRAATLNKELALAYKGMGDALTKQNKTKEAAQYYNRAKSFGQTLPTNTGLTAARDLKKRKRWSQALKEFQDVAEAQPTSEVYVEIGDCYVGLEQPLSASQAYRKAIELDAKSALAHYKFGEVMFKLREHASAMESFERALGLDLEGTVINRKRAREMADQSAEKIKQKK